MHIPKQAKLGFNVSALASVVLACASLMTGRDASGSGEGNIRGTQAIYGAIPPDQIEHLSTPDRIKNVTRSGSMMAIWEALEHGERVECLDCIPSVEPLLYDANPRTREIAAWWLRRRIFGVFGKGGVYERTLDTLASDADPKRRVYAAYALGEFLASPGVDACATAIDRDGDPDVRAAAASALGRLNDDGRGALGKAMGDGDPRVKLAALTSAGRINTFKDVGALIRLGGDGDAQIRRRAADIIGTLRAKDAVDTLLGLAKDADANVRNSACHALGQLHDARARTVLEEIKQSDPNGLVRDQADMALRRL